MNLYLTSLDFRRFFLLQFTRQLLKHSVDKDILGLEYWVKEEESKIKKEEIVEIKKESEEIKIPFIKEKVLPSRINLPKIPPVIQKPLIQKPQVPQAGNLQQYSKSREIKTEETNPIEEKPFKNFNQNSTQQTIAPQIQVPPVPIKKTIPRSIPIQAPQRKLPGPLSIPPSKLPPHLRYIKPVPAQEKIQLGKLDSLANDLSIRAIECNGPDIEIFTIGRNGRKKTEIILTKEEVEAIVNEFAKKSQIPPTEGVYRVAVGNLLLSAIISEVGEPRFIISKINPMQNF